MLFTVPEAELGWRVGQFQRQTPIQAFWCSVLPTNLAWMHFPPGGPWSGWQHEAPVELGRRSLCLVGGKWEQRPWGHDSVLAVEGCWEEKIWERDVRPREEFSENKEQVLTSWSTYRRKSSFPSLSYSHFYLNLFSEFRFYRRQAFSALKNAPSEEYAKDLTSYWKKGNEAKEIQIIAINIQFILFQRQIGNSNRSKCLWENYQML